MEFALILRELWRRRVLVAVVAMLALAVAVALTFRLPSFESRKYEVGVASARILVDTPSSQVIEVAPKGSESLGVRADLIASLMTQGVVKAEIAKRAGIAPDDLVGVSEASAELDAPNAEALARGNVLTTRVPATTTGEQLPIIEVEAQAADARRAVALANAAIEGLGDYLDSKAAAQQVTNAKRLRVSGLGAPQGRDVVRGPRHILALFGAAFILFAGCAAILGYFAVARHWQAASDQEILLELFEQDEFASDPPRDGGPTDLDLRREQQAATDDDIPIEWTEAPARSERPSKYAGRKTA